MGYRRQKSYSRYNNNYASAGGYDSTGRWRSEAWHMDGGANDEGWHQSWCNYCGKETEHGRGSGCVPCGDRIVAARHNRAKNKKASKKIDKNPHQLDRWAVLKLYEISTGPLFGFLESLSEQNQKRCLTPKQVSIGAEVLSKVVDKDIVDRLWTRKELPVDSAMKIGSIVRLKDAINPMLVVGYNCPFSRHSNEFELRSMENPDAASSWVFDDGRWVIIK